jgi:hypothetical protein
LERGGTWLGSTKERSNLAFIGNGKKVNIWRYNRLSRDGALKVAGGIIDLRPRRVKALFGNVPNG